MALALDLFPIWGKMAKKDSPPAQNHGLLAMAVCLGLGLAVVYPRVMWFAFPVDPPGSTYPLPIQGGEGAQGRTI